MIVVKNLRNEKPRYLYQVKVDRSSVLGNPFYMASESARDEVCDKYEKYFNEQIKTNARFKLELDRLCTTYKVFGKLELYCWCAPKRCHAETIKRYIESEVK